MLTCANSTTNGNEMWAVQFGSDALDALVGVTLLGPEVYVAGFTEGVMPDQDGEGNTDGFIHRLDQPPTEEVGPFLRGDCDGDGAATGTVTDAVFNLEFNFQGGDLPPCLAACDTNGDNMVLGQVTDAVYDLMFNFRGGPPPPRPFPECGPSSALGDLALGCEFPLAEPDCK